MASLFDHLFQPAVAPFTGALLLMLMIGAVQALGLAGDAGDVDADGDAEGHGGGALDWLNAGRVPLLMLLVLFLAAFGSAGLVVQQLAAMSVGLLPWPAAMAAAAAVAVPATRAGSRLVGRLLPGDESAATDIEMLAGRRARVVIGEARAGHPARARVEDARGGTHFVMVEPEGDERFTADTLLLLTRREDGHFRAVAIEPDIFSDIPQLLQGKRTR